MTIKVELKGMLDRGEVREVELPDNFVVSEQDFMDDAIARKYMLMAIWHYGQNDFQPKNYRSLVMGDVILLYGRKFEVDMFGFKEYKN